MEIISNLKENPKMFYKFAKTKSIVQSDIGPLRNSNNVLKTDNLDMAEVLADQYYNIGQNPQTDLNDSGFIDDLTRTDDGLNNIIISEAEIKETIQKLPLKSGPGLMGFRPIVLSMEVIIL